MSLSIDDLRPKNFTITVKGVELECLPLKLSHTLTIASIGNVFENISGMTYESSKKLDTDIRRLIDEVIPSLQDKEIDGMTMMDIITKIGEGSMPSDVEFLDKNGVELNVDPKAEKAG